MNEHVIYTVGLASQGHLLHAGALLDEGSGPALTGLGFSRLSPAQLQPMIDKDPAVAAGMESYRLVTYSFPKGGIGCPRAARRQLRRAHTRPHHEQHAKEIAT